MAETDRELYDRAWTEWSDMIDRSPAPRHRRRIIRSILRRSQGLFSTICDVGCGDGALLREVLREVGPGVRATGLDVSVTAIERNRKAYGDTLPVEWIAFDLDSGPLPGEYDVVVSTEVLEHVSDWQTALARFLDASKRFVIVSVPSGTLYPIDERCGHVRHFNRPMIDAFFGRRDDFSYQVFYWGFPFHSLYKRLINLRPDRTYASFAAASYSWPQKLISQVLYALFFLNVKTPFESNQLFLLAQRKG